MKPPLNANPLWLATRDQHHACEQHEVGAALATGTPPWMWYAAWLKALHQLHVKIDPSLPTALHRADALKQDLKACNLKVPKLQAANKYIHTLTTEPAIAGAGYVLTGAHLMGGEIMRRRLQDYPTQHLTWTDRAEALTLLQPLRARVDVAQEARACFTALLAIMDEIAITYPHNNTGPQKPE